jgi:molybdate transport system substrate-binding protein
MRVFGLLVSVLFVASAQGAQVSVAVASNFIVPMAELAAAFEASTGHRARTSSASTGMLYAAIRNGARYAVFLSADAERPALLEKEGLGVAGTRFTYAIGTLELWSADPALAGKDCRAALDSIGTRRLAIANPVTAPYGAAARQFLQRAGLWEQVEARLVFGQNIAQTLQFVVTRNASLGLIAAPQAQSGRVPEPVCRWPVPPSMHAPIEQQAILLRAGDDSEAARAFLAFLRGAEGRAIVRAHGYDVAD